MSEDDRSHPGERSGGMAVSPTASAFDANDRARMIALTILNAKAQGRGWRRLSDILAQCDDAIRSRRRTD
jgi:hypothetical protein